MYYDIVCVIGILFDFTNKVIILPEFIKYFNYFNYQGLYVDSFKISIYVKLSEGIY